MNLYLAHWQTRVRFSTTVTGSWTRCRSFCRIRNSFDIESMRNDDGAPLTREQKQSPEEIFLFHISVVDKNEIYKSLCVIYQTACRVFCQSDLVYDTCIIHKRSSPRSHLLRGKLGGIWNPGTQFVWMNAGDVCEPSTRLYRSIRRNSSMIFDTTSDKVTVPACASLVSAVCGDRFPSSHDVLLQRTLYSAFFCMKWDRLCLKGNVLCILALRLDCLVEYSCQTRCLHGYLSGPFVDSGRSEHILASMLIHNEAPT